MQSTYSDTEKEASVMHETGLLLMSSSPPLAT